jgi:hypothetical protein
VVGHQERLAQDRLALPVRDRREQVRLRVGHQVHHGLQVGPERRDAPVSGVLVGRGVALGPGALRERGGDVVRVDAEADDVPPGDPHVLDQAPRSVRQPRRLRPAQRFGQAGDRPLEVEVGVATTQQDQQLLPEPIDLVPASWKKRSPSRR